MNSIVKQLRMKRWTWRGIESSSLSHVASSSRPICSNKRSPASVKNLDAGIRVIADTLLRAPADTAIQYRTAKVDAERHDRRYPNPPRKRARGRRRATAFPTASPRAGAAHPAHNEVDRPVSYWRRSSASRAWVSTICFSKSPISASRECEIASWE